MAEEGGYGIAVAVDGTDSCRTALQKAVELHRRLRDRLPLQVFYAVGLNPVSKMPYVDHLEKAYNLEIQELARTVEADIRAQLRDRMDENEYEFRVVHGEGESGEVIVRELERLKPTLFFIGTRNNVGLKKLVFGSVSEYVVQHASCAVAVVK